MNFDNKPETDFECYSLKEKIKKYGNPTHNLIITILVIIFIATLIIIRKEKDQGITANYASFYPASTQLYVDADLTDNSISQINKNTNFRIANLSDLLNRILCSENKDKTRLQINKLMSETFGNSFSFGTWNSAEKKQHIYRSLAIFPIERHLKINTLFKYLFSKKARLTSTIYKGYKITFSFNSKGAYLISRNNLFIADSCETLEYIVKNHILKSSDNLYTQPGVRKALGYLEKQRLGTIIVNNMGSNISEFSNFIDERFIPPIQKFSNFIKPMDITALSVLLDKKMIYFKSYTPIDLSMVGNKKIKQAFESAFKTINENMNLKYLPQSTLSYISINDLSGYINLNIELSGIREASGYKQLKDFIKMITSLDIEEEILGSFNKNTTLAVFNTGDNMKYVMIIPVNTETNSMISSMIKLLSLQMPTLTVKKTEFKKVDLNEISSPRLPATFCYAKVNNSIYALGEKTAVQLLINAKDTKQTALTDTNQYKIFEKHAINNSRLTAYVNVQDLSKTGPKNRQIISNSPFNILEQKIKSALFTSTSNKHLIKGSLELILK